MIPGIPASPTRFVLGVLVPGTAAAAPWLAFAERALHPQFSPALGGALAAAAVTIVGCLLESFGSWIERAWDCEREFEWNVDYHWYSYLCAVETHRPVAYSYISRMASVLSFELSMVFASPTCAVGLARLVWASDDIRWLGCYVALGFAAALVFGLHAYQTHRALCKTRMQLNERRFIREGCPGSDTY